VLDLLRCRVHLLLALLATTTETEDEVEGRFLLDVVVREGAAVFELLAGEDQALLIWGNAFFVCGKKGVSVVVMIGVYYIRTLNFGLDIVDRVGGFDLEGDGFARKGLDEDLHDGLGG